VDDGAATPGEEARIVLDGVHQRVELRRGERDEDGTIDVGQDETRLRNGADERRESGRGR